MNLNDFRKAIASPGMDTRFWLRTGTIDTVNKNDDNNTITADIVLIPEGSMTTATMLSIGSNGATIYPIKKDDFVLVFFPDGNETMAPLFIGPLNTATNTIPDEAYNNADDTHANIHTNKKLLNNYDTITSEATNDIVFIPQKMVKLGSEGATDPAVLYNELNTAWGSLMAIINAMQISLVNITSTLTPVYPPINKYTSITTPTISSAKSDKVVLK